MKAQGARKPVGEMRPGAHPEENKAQGAPRNAQDGGTDLGDRTRTEHLVVQLI